VREDAHPLTAEERSVLAVLLDAGSERLSMLATLVSLEVARRGVASLQRRGLVDVDRVEELPKGQTVDRPVSRLTRTVRSTSNLAVTTLSSDEAAAAIADPASWIEGIIPSWLEATAGSRAAEAYREP
jgi:hypothetical protein